MWAQPATNIHASQESGYPAAIGRASLDGGTVETDFVTTGLLNPRGIVVW